MYALFIVLPTACCTRSHCGPFHRRIHLRCSPMIHYRFTFSAVQSGVRLGSSLCRDLLDGWTAPEFCECVVWMQNCIPLSSMNQVRMGCCGICSVGFSLWVDDTYHNGAPSIIYMLLFCPPVVAFVHRVFAVDVEWFHLPR
jgi:hypothetical protein